MFNPDIINSVNFRTFYYSINNSKYFYLNVNIVIFND
jgi:hypothetical protein